jgi:hypothetical protein
MQFLSVLKSGVIFGKIFRKKYFYDARNTVSHKQPIRMLIQILVQRGLTTPHSKRRTSFEMLRWSSDYDCTFGMRVSK